MWYEKAVFPYFPCRNITATSLTGGEDYAYKHSRCCEGDRLLFVSYFCSFHSTNFALGYRLSPTSKFHQPFTTLNDQVTGSENQGSLGLLCDSWERLRKDIKYSNHYSSPAYLGLLKMRALSGILLRGGARGKQLRPALLHSFGKRLLQLNHSSSSPLLKKLEERGLVQKVTG